MRRGRAATSPSSELLEGVDVVPEHPKAGGRRDPGHAWSTESLLDWPPVTGANCGQRREHFAGFASVSSCPSYQRKRITHLSLALTRLESPLRTDLRRHALSVPAA